MDEMLIIGLIKKMSLFAGVVGFLAGMDLLLGGRILHIITGTLDKSIDIDKSIIKITSSLRKKLDNTAMDFNRTIANASVRIILGALCAVLSLLIILLSRI